MKGLVATVFVAFLLIAPQAFGESVVSIRGATATAAADSTPLAHDEDTSTGWQPGSGDASIRFDFNGARCLTRMAIDCSGGSSRAILITDRGVKQEINLTTGSQAISLPFVLTENLTIALRNAPAGLRIDEVVFTDTAPKLPIRTPLTASASTTLENKIDRYGPQLAIDGKLSTAWTEGAATEKGQWLEIQPAQPTFVYNVGFITGYSKYNQKVGEVWFKNYRIRAARVDFGNGWYYDATFEDRIDYQYVPVGMELSKVRFTIVDVYPTLKWKDAPISEVKFIYEYIDDVKFEAGFDYDAVLKSNPDPHYLVLRIKGAYNPQAERAPVNVALVIDQSGSMSEQNRMLHAKEAAKLIVSSLGPKDYLSLTSFDEKVYTRQTPIMMADDSKNTFIRAIDALSPAGTTNIYSALEQGVELVRSTQSDQYSKRILLLSDGKPTAGNKNPDAIAGVARKGLEQDGIITTTFGVGADYNEDLMSNIALSSRGSYYHITNPEQMFKVFISELSSILKVLGRDAVVTVQLPKNLVAKEVYGYKFTQKDGQLTIPLKPISAGDEQKVVIELTPSGVYPSESTVELTLTYQDALNPAKKVTLEASRVLEGTGDNAAVEASRNPVVLAEVLSTRSAMGLEEAARKYETGSAADARTMLAKHIETLKKDNQYLKSSALEEEIAVLEGILTQMSGSSTSSAGKLAVKEAKAAAIQGKTRSFDDTSLSDHQDDPEAEMRRLLASNFAGTESIYGDASELEIIAQLVQQGLPSAKAATMCNTMGYRAYKRKAWDDALSFFDAAIGYDGTHVLAIYNAACTWGLKGNATKAVEYLGKLVGINKPAAEKRLVKAQTDPDLDPVRNEKVFIDFMSAL